MNIFLQSKSQTLQNLQRRNINNVRKSRENRRGLHEKQRAEVAEILNARKFSNLHFISPLVQKELM